MQVFLFIQVIVSLTSSVTSKAKDVFAMETLRVSNEFQIVNITLG